MTNIVALARAGQVQAALRIGTEVIIACRTTNTITTAALPLMRGDHSGPAWHGTKIAMWVALCSTNPTSGMIVVDFDDLGFTVEVIPETALCATHSVLAHSYRKTPIPLSFMNRGGTSM